MRLSALFVLVGGVLCAALAGCGERRVEEKSVREGAKDSAVAAQPTAEVEHPEWGALFNEVKADSGCAIVVEQPGGRVHIFNRSRAERRYLPASTFKIFNSLVALDAGVADSSTFLLRWDGVDRKNPQWNKDQTLDEAFHNSTVWYYQELARRVGPGPYLTAMRREHYGNSTIGGPVDKFWLDNSLQVSAREQVEFLERLQADSLGFSPRSQRIVRQIMVQRDTLGALFRWKTGWGTDPQKKDIGWIVGWVERGERRWFFALNLQASGKDYPMIEARLKVLFGILRSLGVAQ